MNNDSNSQWWHDIREQVHLCREAFGGSCDVFLHTWDRLEKGDAYFPTQQNSRCQGRCAVALQAQRSAQRTSAWPCVLQLHQWITPTAVTVETQEPYPVAIDETRWNSFETLKSFRQNAASMQRGVRLMLEHSKVMGIRYSAAVRMRGDLSSTRMKQEKFRSQFLSSTGWRHIRRRADSAHTTLACDRELVTCGRPRAQRVVRHA